MEFEEIKKQYLKNNLDREVNFALAEKVIENDSHAEQFFILDICIPILRTCLHVLMERNDSENFLGKYYIEMSKYFDSKKNRATWHKLELYLKKRESILNTYINKITINWVLNERKRDNNGKYRYGGEYIDDRNISDFNDIDMAQLEQDAISKLPENFRLLYELSRDIPEGTHDSQSRLKRAQLFDKYNSSKPELLNKTPEEKYAAITRDLSRMHKKYIEICKELLTKDSLKYGIIF